MQLAQQADTSVTDRLQSSVSEIFGQILPSVLGAAILIFAGYVAAKWLESLADKALRKAGLNRMLERGGVTQAVARSGTRLNPTRVIANLIFWFVMFVVILIVANVLGLDTLANVMSSLVSYVPSVIAAVVIILVGVVLGGFVEGLIAASAGAVHGGRSLARVGRVSVILLAVFMALQELGIATEIVTTAFAILFGAIALAMALAFGLGNRELAGEITREWYERYKREREETLARERSDDAAAEAESWSTSAEEDPSDVKPTKAPPYRPDTSASEE
jgi:small-conductance mechanosensitive channel